MRGFLGFTLAIAICWSAHGNHASAQALKVIHPVQGARAAADDFPLALLELAMSRSERDYELEPTTLSMNESRSRAILEAENPELTVAWYGTSMDSERRLRPVRIPIYRGLLGHRLFLIHRDKQALFRDVKSVDDLKSLLALQGQGWSDIEILNAAGLKVSTSRYANLFRMIDGGRGDYFPRGVTEIFGELEQYQRANSNLAVEEEVVLIYPFAMFYFVSLGNAELHDAIYGGLLAAYDDGSFMKLFNSHPAVAQVLERARLDDRRRIAIDNPLMTEETKAIPARYWHGGPPVRD